MPIEEVMRTGIRLDCADGVKRLCFPVLCEYIADMEEQWLLSCQIRPACVKCHFPHKDASTSGPGVTPESFRSRTDEHARQTRAAGKRLDLEPTAVNAQGYHMDGPFSRNYWIGGIQDALGPDLLHQVSKCFMDYLLQKWIFPLIDIHWEKRKVSKGAVKTEIDSRFAMIPGYPNLRRFARGVFTSTHHWTVHEYKAMMKVAVGILEGVCPPEGLALMIEYLHIHRLSHYAVHTEESLGWLESAISTFWKILKAPGGPFSTNELIDDDWQTAQKLHYFWHYANTVREKGALPSYSTDRTEIWHKPLNSAFRRSNKGTDVYRFILTEQTRLAAFHSMVDGMEYDDSDSDSDSEEVTKPGEGTPSS